MNNYIWNYLRKCNDELYDKSSDYVYDNNENLSDSEKSAYSDAERLAIDIRDYNLLTMQAQGEAIEIIGYILEYSSTMGARQVISDRYSEEDNINDLDVDTLALYGAIFLLYGQSIITPIAQINYQNFNQHFDTESLNAGRSATFEIFYGDLIEEIAYIFNLIGVMSLYDISRMSNS